MNFATSTHKSRWLFTKDALLAVRERLNKECIETVEKQKRVHTSSEPSEAEKRTLDVAPVTLEEERKLLRFYENQILALCSQLKYPTKVRATALVYFKRFFLTFSCMNYEPMKMMLTCIYLAGKTEEAYIGAEEFCRTLKQDPATVLRNEVAVLQALKFDLVVHSPYRALAGFMEDLEECRRIGPSSGADPPLLEAGPELMARLRAAATSAVDALLMTDAPLLHPPGQLALAALRSGARKTGLKLSQYLERVAHRGMQVCHPPSPPAEDPVVLLGAALDDIDKLGMEGAQKVEAAEVVEIDKRLKAWRNPLVDPNSEAYRMAAAAADKEKAARREAKVRARKEAQAAEEAKLLGMPQAPPPQPAGAGAGAGGS